MATIKDVAQMAGVSISTVSHVINGTRFCVGGHPEQSEKAMKTLDYEPNVAAPYSENPENKDNWTAHSHSGR